MTALGRARSRVGRLASGGRGGSPAVVLGVVAAGLLAGLLVGSAGPLAAIVIVGGVIGILAASTMPGALLAMYLLVPFYKGAVQPYLPVDLTVILASANALQLVPMLLERRSRGISVAGLILWVALAGLVLSGTLWAPDQTAAFRTASTFLLLVAIPLAAACLRVGSELRFVKQMLWSFFGIGVLTAFLGLVNLSSIDRLVVLGMDTINVAAAAMLVPLVGVAFVLPSGRAGLRFLVLVFTPIAFLVALASGSRGPILTIIILALVAGAVRVSHTRVIRPRLVVEGVLGVAAVLSVIALASAALPAISLERYSAFESFVGGALGASSAPTVVDTSSEARARLLGVAFQMWADHPLLGAGTASFATLSPLYVGPVFADQYPHNSVAQFASEYGIVGVALFASFVGLALRRRVSSDAAWTAVRLLGAYFLLNSLLSNDALNDRTMWGLLLLLLLARVVPDRTSPAASWPDEKTLARDEGVSSA